MRDNRVGSDQRTARERQFDPSENPVRPLLHAELEHDVRPENYILYGVQGAAKSKCLLGCSCGTWRTGPARNNQDSAPVHPAAVEIAKAEKKLPRLMVLEDRAYLFPRSRLFPALANWMEIVAQEAASAPFFGRSRISSVFPSSALESLAPSTEAICPAFQTKSAYWLPASPDALIVRRSRSGVHVSERMRKPFEAAPIAGNVEE